MMAPLAYFFLIFLINSKQLFFYFRTHSKTTLNRRVLIEIKVDEVWEKQVCLLADFSTDFRTGGDFSHNTPWWK